MNTGKTNSICYRSRCKRNNIVGAITFYCKKIPWRTSAKSLDVIIDFKLRFNEHACRKKQEATQLHGFMHPMLGWPSKLSIIVITLIYLAFWKSVVMLTSSVCWALCGTTRRKKLQTQQHKAPWILFYEIILFAFTMTNGQLVHGWSLSKKFVFDYNQTDDNLTMCKLIMLLLLLHQTSSYRQLLHILTCPELFLKKFPDLQVFEIISLIQPWHPHNYPS